MDNGPESSGMRTQFQRMVDVCDQIGKPIHLLNYSALHSKDNRIGGVGVFWNCSRNGTESVDVETMLEWAKSMTWKGIHPVVELSRKVYQKGIALGKKAMQAVESRLQRHSALPKWDIQIRPDFCRREEGHISF